MTKNELKKLIKAYRKDKRNAYKFEVALCKAFNQTLDISAIQLDKIGQFLYDCLEEYYKVTKSDAKYAAKSNAIFDFVYDVTTTDTLESLEKRIKALN